MKSGIKSEDIAIGSGKEAKSDDYVLVEIHWFLNKGEEVKLLQCYPDNQLTFNLNSRDTLPGLRYGIVGMLEGGIRKLKISPHLAFGEKGIEDKIPPNAVIICNVKLLKIVDEKFRLPSTYDRKRQIVVAHRGEAAGNKPRWNFGIVDDGVYGITVNYPIPGQTWRYTKNRNYEGKLTKEEMDIIFDEIQKFNQSFPKDVVEYNNVWADMSEPAGNTPRERDTNRLCISVMFFKGTYPGETFYVTEDNQAFYNTFLYKHISALLKKPELQE